jgi:hypothetical protein
LFKFKKEVTAAQVQEVIDAFRALPSKIDAIDSFEHGTDVSVENKAAGFTHGFSVTFRDEKGRDVYLPIRPTKISSSWSDRDRETCWCSITGQRSNAPAAGSHPPVPISRAAASGRVSP